MPQTTAKLTFAPRARPVYIRTGSAIRSWFNKKRFSSLRGAEKFPPMFNGLRRWMAEFDETRVFANVGYTKWARSYEDE